MDALMIKIFLCGTIWLFSAQICLSQSCPVFGTNEVELDSLSNRERIFLNYESPFQCTGTVTSWQYCYYEDASNGDPDTQEYAAKLLVYRRMINSTIYQPVPNSTVLVSITKQNLTSNTFECRTLSLGASEQFQIQENDIIATCIINNGPMGSYKPLRLVGIRNRGNEEVYQYNVNRYQECTSEQLQTVDTENNAFISRSGGRHLHLHVNVERFSTSLCSAGDNPPPFTSSTMSGTYLNTDSPIQCTGAITAWHYCYYPPSCCSEATTTLAADVGVWRMDSVQSRYELVSGSNVTIQLLPEPSHAKIVCTNFPLQEGQYVGVNQDDIIGITLPNMDPIPLLASGATGFSLRRSSQQASLPPTIATSELSQHSNMAIHLYPIIGSSIVTLQTTMSSAAPTTVSSGPPMTVSSGPPTTVSSGPPTTVSSVAPTTVSSGPPTTVSSVAPTTVSSGPPTTVSSAAPTTVSSVAPTTVSSGPPTTVSSVAPTTVSSGPPTTVSSVAPTTVSSGPPTTMSHAAPLTTALRTSQTSTVTLDSALLSTTQITTTITSLELVTTPITLSTPTGTTDATTASASPTSTVPNSTITNLIVPTATNTVPFRTNTNLFTDTMKNTITSALNTADTSTIALVSRSSTLSLTTTQDSTESNIEEQLSGLSSGALVGIIIAILTSLVAVGIIVGITIGCKIRSSRHSPMKAKREGIAIQNTLYGVVEQEGDQEYEDIPMNSLYDEAADFNVKQDLANLSLATYDTPICSSYDTVAPTTTQETPTEMKAKDVSEDNIIIPESHQGNTYSLLLEAKENGVAEMGEHNLYYSPADEESAIYEQLDSQGIKLIRKKAIKITGNLGAGQFGTVEKGIMSPENIEVAIKSLKSNASSLDRVKFLQEAAIMAQFKHPNVVALHGIVRNGNTVSIVVELLHKGDLLEHLLSLRPDTHQTIPSSLPEVMLSFSQQIAIGMVYLSNRGFVHRDLAARNVLVSESNVCKIADFGMSRDLAQSDYYVSHGGKIPVKWTAPEAINYKRYSSFSDVWSYGCLLYEIWSLGHKPYETKTNVEVVRLVDSGKRLPPPPGCPRVVYKIMMQCWNPTPSDRPTFRAILLDLLDNESTVLHIPKEDRLTNEQAGVLGSPLVAGEEMYSDLQDIYEITEQTCM